MSENSVVIINLKDLSKINDAYCALNLSGVCVDYDDEIQMKFGKRIIIGQVLHKYPAYRDLKNPDRDCLVLMMRKAYPKICLVEETRVFRFMILGSELVSKLLQVQLNSFLAFMNFKMFGTFNTSEPSFSIGNSCGVVWIFPNLNHITSKVRNCTEYIEKIFGKQHDGHNEEMRGSSSRNHLRKGRPDAQRKFTQGTCIHDGYTSTPVTKKKNNSNILVEGFNEPKTTSSFIKESLEARREQKSNSTKFETGSQRDSLLVGKNYNTCLNTYLQKKNFASSDHQTLHRKDTCACSQIAVSCRKQCCNAINCCNTNYMTNMLEICSSSSKTSFNDQKVCLKYNVCECKRRNDAPLCQISERCLSPDHVKTSVRTYINEKSNSLAPVSDQHFGIRNCKCHEQKIGSVINASSVVEAHDRVQNWLDNIQVLPRTHSTLPLKDLSKKGRSYFNHNFGSQRQKTEKVNNYVESESNITVKRKTNSLENNYFSKSNNRNKRKLFFADPNVSLIKVQADKTGIILSKEDSHKFEDNHISDNVVSDIRNFPEIYGKIDGKEIKKEMSEEYISREKNHSVCNLESHETNGEINDASKTVYSNKKSNNSKAEESTLIENASLDMNKCDENNILDLNKSGDNNCDSCNLTSSTIPVSNEGVNINSQQTQTESSQPYYDAQENSELKNSSLGTELGDISKSLSEQSVTSLKKLFSYEDKEAREVTLAKLRKLKQEVQIKSVLVDILPELSHLRPLAIVKGVCRSGCKKYFAVEELPSFRDVTLTKCKYCRQTLHRICPECTKDGDKFLCLLYSFGLHVLYGTNVIRIAVYGRDAVRFLGCPLETYLSWSSVSSNIIMKFNKIRVWVPPEDWSEVTMLQLNLMTNKHYDGTIMPKVVNTYFGDALYRKVPEVNEWKMAKEAKLQNVERICHGSHNITEPLSCNTIISTRKRPKKIIHHKRMSIARKQKASMDAHVRRITEASLSKLQTNCPIAEDEHQCECPLFHKLPNRRIKRPTENDWNASKKLNAPPKKETGIKILKTQDVQTIETASISNISTRIESEIKTFKEKREDFINYLEVLQSEIKALDIPYRDNPAESSAYHLSAKESSKENVDKNLKGINKTTSEEILNPTNPDISVTKMEHNTTGVTNESSKEIAKENKEQGAKQIAKEVTVKDKINVESNNEKKGEHFSKELVHKTDTNSSEKKEKQVEGQPEHKKHPNKKIEATSSEDKKSLEGPVSTQKKSSDETDIKAEPKESKDEVETVQETVNKSKKLRKKRGSCIRRITTITSGELKTKLGSNSVRNPKVKPLKEEDINHEVLELLIPRLRTLANQGKIIPAKTKGGGYTFRLKSL